jgi:hypothetical protein
MTDNEDAKANTTMHGRAMADAALEARGRFGTRERAYVVGSEPTVAAPLGKLQSHQQWPADYSVYGEPIDAVPGDMTKVGS